MIVSTLPTAFLASNTQCYWLYSQCSKIQLRTQIKSVKDVSHIIDLIKHLQQGALLTSSHLRVRSLFSS